MPRNLELGGFKAFAFDFDGTLADSIGAHTQARVDAFASMAELTGDSRFVEIPEEIHDQAHQHGSHPQAIIGWILMRSGIAKSIIDPVVDHTVALKKQLYAETCKNGLPAIPGALDVFSYAHNFRPATTGITTTAHRDSEVVPFLIRHGLRGRLPNRRLVTFEDVGESHLKPDPLAYSKTARKFWLKHSGDMLAIEDSPNGILAAKRAGAKTLAVCTTHTPDELMVAHPTFIFQDMAEVLAAAKE